MTDQTNDDYGIAQKADLEPMEAPTIPYQPPIPKKYDLSIGLIGCGGITAHHLKAYKKAGFQVTALCDIVRERAEERRNQFFPEARIFENYQQLLEQDDVDVVDIATHPLERVPILELALLAGKHVLSQKPFVLDLDYGYRMVELANRQNVKLAVNQNGRWAPHFSYIRHAIENGIIGDVMSSHLAVHWDHSWICGLEFEKIKHLILYDFAIHWFDITTCFMKDTPPQRLFSTLSRSPVQEAKPAMLAQTLILYENGQSSLVFDADTRYGPLDRTTVIGSKGTLHSMGPDLQHQNVTLYTEDGYASPKLEGEWFLEGFQGTMAELLCAIEDGHEPNNSAENNLKSLALCFAAVASAEDGMPKVPGEIRCMPS